MRTTTTTPSGTEFATSVRRVRGLAAFNARLLLRNRLATFYAFVVPLLALGTLLPADPDSPASAVVPVTTVLLMALLFPVYYNVLSAVVTRRDELVLKRMRTGEVRDSEILTSIALPGVAIGVLICLIAIIGVAALGFGAPVNAPLMLLAMVASCVTFVGLALWTAAWTRTAEAAQLTSAPVMILAVSGLMRPVLPERVQEVMAFLPGVPVEDVVRAAWLGLDDDGARLSLLETLTASIAPLGILVAWTVLALWLANRSMQWEPRA